MLESCIENLVKNLPKTDKSQNIDLVLEGGAFNGSYQIGSLMFLKEMEKRGGDRFWIDRFFARHLVLVYYWIMVFYYFFSPANA